MTGELDTERAVLGELLYAPERIPEVTAILRASDFAAKSHVALFECLIGLHEAGTPIDFLTVGAALKRSRRLALVGGADALAGLAQSITTCTHVLEHARLVRKAAVDRRKRDAAARLAKSRDPAETERAQRDLLDAVNQERSVGEAPAAALETVCAADVEEREIRWLVPGLIPLGMLTTLAGPGGLGKSSVALDIAAQVSRGGMAMRSFHVELGSALIIACEEDIASVVTPKLRAAGADLAKIQLIGEAPEFPRDGEALRQRVKQMGDCRFIVVDTVGDVLGRAEENSNSDVRAVLAPLRAIAEEFNLAVVVIAHLRKSGHAALVNRILGSVALANVSRSVLAVLRDGETANGRVLSLVKSNYAKLTETCHRFEMIELSGSLPRVSWLGTCERSESDLLGTLDAIGTTRKPRDAAKEFLTNHLRAGPAEQSEVMAEAERLGHSEKTLRRAKGELGVVTSKATGAIDGCWKWSLPDDKATSNMATPSEEGTRPPSTDAAASGTWPRAKRVATFEGGQHPHSGQGGQVQAVGEARCKTEADAEERDHLAQLRPERRDLYRARVEERTRDGHPEPRRVTFRELSQAEIPKPFLDRAPETGS